MSGLRIKHTFRLPPDLSAALADYAARKRVTQALVVETALATFLSGDNAEHLEAALARRLDRLTRQADALAWHVELGNETLSLFVRLWMVNNPPLPDDALATAQMMGKERWVRFIETLNRRMEFGPRLRDEVSEDIETDD
ncbi:CopG family transcriptional regulator [Sphingomonas sp. R647]|uniref:CopG family transcriptional regulator n=1 Tax=Sphingomonas sp. R647 TaxID=2875233 RepID=UPI001CD2CE9A|nr:CopG family transcriptional regulator [Sphingomonas sp. R647]MCA1200156.1 CopG family transcriptional regulator [Sphingomonas sp. R647]